jgi:hypothetical protein
MAFERKWGTVPPQALTANGGQFGLVTVADTAGFRVKQVAALKGTALPNLPVQIKIVLSDQDMIVGHVDNQIANWKPLNISAYTVAASSNISAEWQDKNKITNEDIQKAVYEADPVVALRTLGIDQYGDPYTEANPLPVSIDSTISIGEVEIIGPSGNLLDPNSDGSIKSVGLFNLPYDSIAASYPSSVQENYQSYIGGLGGTPVQLVVVIYTDLTKNVIQNVVRTPPG